MTNRETFINRIKSLEDEEKNCKKNYNIIGTIRLVAFVVTLIYIYLLIRRISIYTSIGTLFSLTLFVFLIKQHSNISYRLNKIKNLITINKKYIKRIDGNWSDFQDLGQDGIDLNHPYSADLDIFGKNSLFQLINTTNTFFGRKKLIDLLKSKGKSIDNIVNRQNAVEELSQKIKFCEDLESAGNFDKKNMKDPSALLNYSEDVNALFEKSPINTIVYFLPVFSILFCAVTIIFKINYLYYFIPFIFVIHAAINFISYRNIPLILDSVEGFNDDLQSYVNAFKLIEGENFQDEYLRELKNNLFFEGKSSSKVMGELTTIINNINLKHNFLIYFFLNLLIFWDFRCLFSLQNWKSKYGKLIRKYINALGDFEVISSLSVLTHMDTEYSFPTFTTENLVLKAESLGHPLINNGSRVSNNFNMIDNILIVTGSNMSGKTTFLRTVGINLVLAYAGAPICGKSMKCSLMDIFTSMRINDNLMEGASTFYVELMRIKQIIDNLLMKEPMIFLIDEIFRGTNSRDRIIGAKSVLKNLDKPWLCGLISTHDFELCDLEYSNEKKIVNYHFSESYTENKIHFDYKLREGRCDSTNAKYLMKMVGIEIED
ncbi:MutS-related protein [Clostridium pasteurianum]|uniref:Mismatch repair ATPase (MutS family) n=1 Tax=Clostridium pasteurianum BC1 TaxID=86416 RepID=R4K1D5_CLOPA|nr:MutS family DNA mismatch repair protein [Clostridium pasteurianum]AGK96383.1 mismatch repair ATPase (MutS family) [Clostridium pasteurianum BC1]